MAREAPPAASGRTRDPSARAAASPAGGHSLTCSAATRPAFAAAHAAAPGSSQTW